jgi:hypothetical protein
MATGGEPIGIMASDVKMVGLPDEFTDHHSRRNTTDVAPRAGIFGGWKDVGLNRGVARLPGGDGWA